MFHIIKDFSIKIAPEDYSLYRSLAPIYHQLKVITISFYSSLKIFLFLSQVYFIQKLNVMKIYKNLQLN